jgi:hypothetical protein
LVISKRKRKSIEMLTWIWISLSVLLKTELKTGCLKCGHGEWIGGMMKSLYRPEPALPLRPVPER